MSNNYLQFSERLELESVEEIEWMNKALRQVDEWRDLPKESDFNAVRDSNGEPFPEWLTESYPVNGDTPRIDCRMHVDPEGDAGSAWFVSEEGNDPAIVCDLVSAFLEAFNPDGCFTLTYAETCSAMRLGEFGGGAMFVTSQGWNSINAHGWVADQKAYFRENGMRKQEE